MSNGKDFYVELRKQVTALQQGGERAGMYFSMQKHTRIRAARRISRVEGPFSPLQLLPLGHLLEIRDANSKHSVGG